MSGIIMPVTGIIAMSILATIMIMSEQYLSGTLFAISTITFIIALYFSIKIYGYKQQRKILSDLREEISNGGK